MTKIKITSKDREIEGQVTEGRVTPFGTSAHISFPKKHTGKVVEVVTPSEPQYIWLLTDGEKKEIFKVCEKLIKKKNGKLAYYRLEALDNIKNTKFKLHDLITVVEVLKHSKKHNHLVIKIKKLYNINSR